MIGYLQGTVLELTDEACVLLTDGGVGYEVSLPSSVMGGLPGKGERAELYIHTAVSEKAIALYGFSSFEELGVFRTLISIDKLGPKKAMAILSRFGPDQLREIAFREDGAMLATVPGIGPKSARQILWQLKEKVEGLKGKKTTVQVKGPQGEFLDALAGLVNLGYSEDEARTLLKEIFEEEDDMDAAGAIRLALKKIAAARL